jgi:DcmR-like sensory protein
LGHSHSICIFDTDLPKKDYWHAPIYEKINHYISNGYVVIYVLEANAIATVRRMSRMGIEVEDYVESGALTIISNDVFYSPQVASPILIEQWRKLFSNIEKKNGKSKGFVVMGMPSSAFFTSLSHQKDLVEYESAVAKWYDGSIEAICCYTTESLNYMPLKYIIALLNSHQNTVHRECPLQQWSNSRALSIIERSLNESLGSHGSGLLLTMLGHNSGLNGEDAGLSPTSQLEDNLRKALCSTTAGIILEKIKAEFMKDIVF